MTDQELMQQALEALDTAYHQTCSVGRQKDYQQITAAIAALRERLVRQEQAEPVACNHCNGTGRMVRDPDIGTDQECFVCDGAGFHQDTPPVPAVREWVDLSEDEATALWEGTDDRDSWELMMRVQAKLREKNGGTA